MASLSFSGITTLIILFIKILILFKEFNIRILYVLYILHWFILFWLQMFSFSQIILRFLIIILWYLILNFLLLWFWLRHLNHLSNYICLYRLIITFILIILLTIILNYDGLIDSILIYFDKLGVKKYALIFRNQAIYSINCIFKRVNSALKLNKTRRIKYCLNVNIIIFIINIFIHKLAIIYKGWFINNL